MNRGVLFSFLLVCPGTKKFHPALIRASGRFRIRKDVRRNSHRFVSLVECLALAGLCGGPAAFGPARGQSLTEQEIHQYTPVGVPLEKIGRPIDETDAANEASLKWNRFAIHDRKTALHLREKTKTAEQKAQEQLAIQALSQSEAFLKAKREQEAKKDPQQKADEERTRARARRAIEKPQEVAKEAEKTKDAATRRREQIAARAILFPREFNTEVEQHTSAALKAKEAEAIRALSQPKAVLEERLWLKKTGSPHPPKGPPEVGNDKARGGNSNGQGKGNGPAKGKGGGL